MRNSILIGVYQLPRTHRSVRPSVQAPTIIMPKGMEDAITYDRNLSRKYTTNMVAKVMKDAITYDRNRSRKYICRADAAQSHKSALQLPILYSCLLEPSSLKDYHHACISVGLFPPL